jgi:hypothetical protein
MRQDPLAYRGGAPRAEGRRLRSVLGDLGRGAGAPFVQMNHPRDHEQHKLEDSAYFTHLAVAGEPYDPTRGLDTEPNRVLAERDPAPGCATSTSTPSSSERPRMRPTGWCARLALAAAPGRVPRGHRQQRLARRAPGRGAAAHLRAAGR